MFMIMVLILEVCWCSQHVGSHGSASLTCCVKSAAASLDLQEFACTPRVDARPEHDPVWIVTSLPCLYKQWLQFSLISVLQMLDSDHEDSLLFPVVTSSKLAVGWEFGGAMVCAVAALGSRR